MKNPYYLQQIYILGFGQPKTVEIINPKLYVQDENIIIDDGLMDNYFNL